MRLKIIPCCLLALFFYVSLHAQIDEEALLLHSPSSSQDHIAFSYASDIWLADRNGNYPRRLTLHEGIEQNPILSPDGQWIAFSANYDGNFDVYVLPITGGTPKRLTSHPSADMIQGWHKDKVLFSSYRESFPQRFSKLYEIGLLGGCPKVLPIQEAHQGTISQDEKHIAYIKDPISTESTQPYRPFKKFRSGETPKVWILNKQNDELEEVPHANASNTYPVWLDNTLYFLSDRDGITNIYSYNQQDQSVLKISNHSDYDVKTLHSNGSELIYEQGGQIVLFDPVRGSSEQVSIFIKPDLPVKRVHFKDVPNINNLKDFPTEKMALRHSEEDTFYTTMLL